MRLPIYVALIVLALTIAACETQDLDRDDQDVPEPGNEQHDDASGGAGSSQSGAQTERGSLGDGTEAFEKLFSERSNTEWSVRYVVSSTGLPEGMVDVEMTQYFGAEEKLRTDVSARGVETRTYVMNGEVTVCTRLDGWFCLESDIETDIHAEIESEIEAGDYSARQTDDRTIAGTIASCFEFETRGGGSGEYCFSQEGVPLYIEAGSEGVTMLLEADEYSLSVPSEVWDVPESDAFPGGFDPSDYI